MRIKQLGELALIERIKKSISLDSSVIKGPGDDCAVLKFTKDKYQLFTCDMLVEGADFKRKENPYLIGRKAIAVSISDIAACAGIPRHCVVSLGVNPATTVDFIDRLLKGMLSQTRKYKINIVGGDISRSEKLTIDTSMLGEVEKKRLILRGGAKKGDIIFVTGKLGGSIFGKHLEFIPRLKEARFLAKNFKVNSMIDISDGLIRDLSHILKESGKGAVIYEALIPQARHSRSINDALYGGEDFELLFTLPLQEAKKLLEKPLKIFLPIGEIVDKKSELLFVGKHGRKRILAPKGFSHF